MGRRDCRHACRIGTPPGPEQSRLGLDDQAACGMGEPDCRAGSIGPVTRRCSRLLQGRATLRALAVSEGKDSVRGRRNSSSSYSHKIYYGTFRDTRTCKSEAKARFASRSHTASRATIPAAESAHPVCIHPVDPVTPLDRYAALPAGVRTMLAVASCCRSGGPPLIQDSAVSRVRTRSDFKCRYGNK